MPIRCPHCSHEMALKGGKPGRFTPKCPMCNEKFVLSIADDPSVMPSVSRLATQPSLMQTAPPAPASSVSSGTIAATSPSSLAPPPPPSQAPSAPVGLAAPSSDVQAPSAVTTSLAGRVGGYDVIQKLGEGGMGAVYLARQVSLDRNVALKVLSPQLASDPQFVVRFTREAYAAAQLTHHNIVAIHDIGPQDEIHFFSMEFVEGQNLGHTVREAGKLDAEAAAGYVLQAARGLKFAHDHGLIHRDIKPENLLLNEQGIVKVADLGLVKRAGVSETQITGVSHPGAARDATQLNMSMGTPAYMPPEQARDATNVDQRADIYSLGCTLYDLLTGRPPFMGRTAIEVITKHQREAITPPEMIVRNVPKTLSAILLKMVAKRPEDRYASMGDVIRALEDFLGVSQAGPFTPKEEHVTAIESAVERFNAAGWAVLRSQLIMAFFATCAIGAGLLAIWKHPLWAASVVGVGVLTVVAYQLVIGITQRTHLFRKFRQLVFGSSIVDWLTYLVVIGVIVMLLIAFDLQWAWFGAAVAAVAVAAAFHFAIDTLAAKDREQPLAQIEAMLKQMRIRGLDEMAIRQFVSKFSGKDWEAFYEALFGYEAKIQARELWGKGERGRERHKFAAWRDPIIRWIDRKQVARRERREQRLLQKVEAKALAAKGIGEAIARKQAKLNAERFVRSAAKVRSTAAKRAMQTLAPGATAPAATQAVPATRIDWIHDSHDADAAANAKRRPRNRAPDQDEDDEALDYEHLTWFQRRFGTPIDFILGPEVRFVLAVIVLLGFGMWFQQNKSAPVLEDAADVIARRRQIDVTSQKIVTDAVNATKDFAGDVASGAQRVIDSTRQRPLRAWFLPGIVCKLLSGWNAAVAGAILLLSVLCTGRLMSVTVLFSAAVATTGHWFDIPGLGYPAPPSITATAGLVIGLFGIIFFRETHAS